MSNKIIISLLVFAVLSYTTAANVANDDAQNINDCLNPGSTPTVFHDKEYVKKGHFFQIQEETVRVPLDGFTPSPITCITVVNQLSDADGGYPKIFEGGVGKNYVIFNFKSKLSKGYDFRATVYY